MLPELAACCGPERVGTGFASKSLRGIADPASAEAAPAAPKDADAANPSESLSLPIHHSARNLKRTRGSTMLERCLGIVLLYGDQQFKRVRGLQGLHKSMPRSKPSTQSRTPLPQRRLRETTMERSGNLNGLIDNF